MSGRLPFQPSSVSAPEFLVPLAGSMYSIVVKWNVSAQRYFFDLYSGDGTWIVTAPLIATAPGVKIDTLVYDPFHRSILVTMLTEAEWHPFDSIGVKVVWRPLGQIVDWTIEDVDPAVLNGPHRCETISPTQFMFYLTGDPSRTFDPGPITYTGSAHRYQNLVKGYVPGATLIFRNEFFEYF